MGYGMSEAEINELREENLGRLQLLMRKLFRRWDKRIKNV